VQSTPDEKGARAAELLQRALNSGEAIEITEGVKVTLKRAPPAFEELVGQTIREGTLALGPAERVPAPTPPPYNARLKAKGEHSTETVDVRLLPAKLPPAGFDGALVGTRGALEVEAIFQQVPGGGQIGWSFHYRSGHRTLREQVAALDSGRARLPLGSGTSRPGSRPLPGSSPVIGRAAPALSAEPPGRGGPPNFPPPPCERSEPLTPGSSSGLQSRLYTPSIGLRRDTPGSALPPPPEDSCSNGAAGFA